MSDCCCLMINLLNCQTRERQAFTYKKEEKKAILKTKQNKTKPKPKPKPKPRSQREKKK